MLTQRTLAVAAVLVALLVARRWTPAALLRTGGNRSRSWPA
jgi:hypothetical protein